MMIIIAGIAYAELAGPHNAANNIGCFNYCHIIPEVKSPYWDHSPSDIDDTPTNYLCNSCHTKTSGPYSMINAPKAMTHSSRNTDDDYGDWTTECTDCHSPHYQEQLQWLVYGESESNVFVATGSITSYAYNGGTGETTLGFDTAISYKTGWDAAKLAKKTIDYRRTILIPDTSTLTPDTTDNLSYQVVAVDEGAKTITVKGDASEVLGTAFPYPFGIIYGQLIREYIKTPSALKRVKLFDSTAGGNGGLTGQSGSMHPKGICQVCHTQTTHWSPTALAGGDVHFPDRSCSDCHDHANGFGHGSGGGTDCTACHGHDAGYEYSPGEYSQGAGTTYSHSTHTENDADDLKGPTLSCDTCHDVTNYPYFTSGTDSNGDGKISLAETDVCDTCHSPLGTYDGMDDATVGAGNNWQNGIYDHDGGNPHTLRVGKEKWCATCHDEVASVVSGITAPNVVGDESGAYTYGTGWGYYKTGHGLPLATTYSASGGLTYGAGKECASCHDYSYAHIDGDARTYVAASDNYQAGYRLKSIGGGEPMNIPHPQNIDDLAPDNYALCFACHDANKYLRTTPDLVTTSFRDDDDIGPWDGGDAPINIHRYHLLFNGLFFDSDWTGGYDSQISCVNCHNVHGSTQLAMVRDGKLVNREPGMEVYYDSAMISPDAADPGAPNPANVTLNSSTGTVFNTATTDNLCAHCHGGEYVKWYRSPPSAPVAPSLDWTGEANYLTDGVDPNSGQGGDYFTFRIEYTDANYQVPGTIQVWIDENDNAAYEEGEKYDMQEVDSGDIDVSDGKRYRVICTVGNAGVGTLSYRFYASDGKFDATDGAATGDPTDNTANTITVTNNAPVLAWTDEDGYTADGVNPNSAEADSTFTFRVKYTDADNNVPTSIQLWVDKDDDGTSVGDEGTELITMDGVDGGDTTYTDGKLYTKDVAIAAAGDNTLSYNFIASDGTDSATGVPTSNRTLNVTTSNTAPLLAWTGETNYIFDGVNPDSDVPDSTFTFRIKYSDPDNNAPSAIQVWVDTNDDDDYLDAGEQLDMTAVDTGDSDYTDGKLYTKDVILTVAGDGIMNYRFYAADLTDDATGTPTDDSFVTVIIGAIKVSCQGTGDYDYTAIQTAINNASNGDTILVADGTCTEDLVIDNKDLTIKSVNGAASTIIDGDGADTVVTIQNGADSTLNGFTITGANRASGYGGGVIITNSSPTISNSIITGNNSQRAAGLYATGSGSTITMTDSTVSSNTSSLEYGGIYLASGVSAVITDTTITANTATSAGGLYMTTSADASLSITGSTISNHTLTGVGAGLRINATGGAVTVDIDDTTISGNNAQRGGALYMTDGGATTTVNIKDSTISTNSSSIDGGAFYITTVDTMTISGSTFSNNSGTNAGALRLIDITSLTVSDSTIRDNSATDTFGGGIQLSGGTANFERSTISGNSSVHRGGGVYISGTTVPTFTNCMITGNVSTSYEGAGLYFTGVGVTANIINSTMSGNRAGGTTGGAMTVADSASVTILNSILYGNGGSSGGSEIQGTVSASYSDIKQSGYEANNNLNTDPSFVSSVNYASAPTSSGDYHLQLSSPAIDMGTATGAPSDDIDSNIRPLGGGIDMGADEVVTVANNAPTLTWTAETNYLADGVDPDMGTDGGSYVFQINYADADNDAPSSIQIWIDTNDDGDFLDGGEKIDMTPVDGDADYTDGKLYTKTETIAYVGDGVLNYRFYAADGTVAATGTPTSNKNVVINTVPTLAWLGSGNYVSDGVDPDSAASGASFTFQVKYTDANNDAPTAIQVWVDINDNGDNLDSGEKLTMTQVDSGDSVYTDGKEYTKTVNLSYAGNGELNYRFYASDGSEATGTPISTGGTVTVTNTAPTLSWLGSGNYVSDGVNPNGALSGTNSFEFRITYTDADNQAPSSIQVWIDEDDSSSYEPGEKYDMTAVDGDPDYTDGKNYTYTATNLTRNLDDYLNYRFAASDSIIDATGTPVSADKPVGVYTANQAPDLDWTSEAGYTIDGVDPDSGADGDSFTFRTKYTDIENSVPSSIQVWVDLDDDSVEDGGELTTLDPVDAEDTAYDDGKLYSATIALSSVTNSSTTYHFKASDGTLAATGNATTDKIVTVTSVATVCAAGPPTCTYVSITNAISSEPSGAYIVVKDGTYSENINYGGKNLNISSQNGAGSTLIQGTGANLPVVTFSNSETSAAVLDGFTIDNQLNTGSLSRGLFISGAAPTINNCIIQGNSATNGTDGGGGVYIVDSSPNFDNCTIKTNVADNRSGCGMYIKGAASGATISNSTIGGTATEDGNKCTNGTGGGIYYTGSTTGTLTISDSNIQYNYGKANGGGIFLNGITNTTVISNTTILDNYTEIANNGYGGGIHANNAPLSITGSSINNNTAGLYRSGGGLYIYSTNGSSNTITGTTIKSNSTGSGGGGGIYIGGDTVLPTLDLSKTYIQGNSASGDGGGIMIAAGTVNSTNTIIVGNRVSALWNYGGGIQNKGTLNLYFSTIADNYAHQGGGLDCAGTENIYNSIIWGNAVGLSSPEIRGSTDILYLTESGGDTSFVSRSTANSSTATTDGDYHLQSNSNCIDTGDATNAPADDIEDTLRPEDITGKGDGTDDYDKGAYEYTP